MAIVWVLGAFLIGAIPWGYLVAHVRFKTDIREHGSQNIGATNVARTLGMKAGVAVLLLDALKGALVVGVTQAYFGDVLWLVGLSGFMAIAGHVFSPFLRFKGGKGIATGLGAIAVMSPQAALIAILAFTLFVVATRIVSLASLAGIAGVVVWMALLAPKAEFWSFAAPAMLLTIWAHRKNWNRLVKGQEPRFGKP